MCIYTCTCKYTYAYAYIHTMLKYASVHTVYKHISILMQIPKHLRIHICVCI